MSGWDMGNYRVGIAGCGRMAGTIDDEVVGYDAVILPYCHAAAYRALGSTHIVAAADINPEKTAAFSQRWKVPSTYSDYRQMIEKENLDILSVTTPATLHHEIVTFAANNGVRAIYCEKAMCCSLSEADDMVEACKRNDVKLNVGTLRRFHPGYHAMRELVMNGSIGEPKAAIAYSLGILMHTHSHTADTIRFLLGDPRANYVQGALSDPEYDKERNAFRKDPLVAMGHVSFLGDVHGFFSPSIGMYEFEVDCTKGAVRVLDNGTDWELRVLKKGAEKWLLHERSGFPTFDRVSPTVRCITDLVTALETGSETQANPEVAREGMELSVGIALSHLKEGARVHLPLEDRALYIPSH